MENQDQKKSFFKAHRKIILSIAIPIAVVGILIGVFFIVAINLLPHEYKGSSAAKLAKRKFNMDSVTWISGGVGRQGSNVFDFNATPWGASIVLGEKDGNEIAVIVDAKSDKYRKPVQVDWMYDVSLTEITERMTNAGVPCIRSDYSPDQKKYYDTITVGNYEYYNSSDYCRLKLIDSNDYMIRMASEIHIDGEELLNRLDVGAVLYYFYIDGGVEYRCLITQEEHMFKAYRYDVQTETSEIMTI